jgi:hypothetical protein
VAYMFTKGQSGTLDHDGVLGPSGNYCPSVHRVREKSIIETYAPSLCNILARVLQE